MPIPGPEVLRRIGELEAQARKIEADSRQAVEEAARQVDELVAGQTDALRELAHHYLPRLSDDASKKGWTEMRATVAEILLRKEDAQRVAMDRLERAKKEREATEAAYKLTCDRVNQLTAHCDELAKQLATRIAEDSEFQSLARRAAEGQARLEQAEASLDEVEHDAKEKLPNYEKSRLFKYLHERQFGTPSYTQRGLTRRLDRWVSGLIDYPKAAAGYRFLKSTPDQMKQLIDEHRTSVHSIIAEVESRQATVASALGLPRAQAEGTQARAEQDEAALRADRARDLENQARDQLSKIQSDQCPFYEEAVDAFHSLLERTERSLIAARAAQTPELTDDQVVARLRRLDEDIVARKQALAERARTTDLAAQRAAAFGELAARFRRAQFDHPRSIFDDEFDVEGQLWAILDGTTDADRVWQHMRRYQRLGPSIAQQTTAALQHPMTQILVQTMAQAVGSALGNYAARATQQNRHRRTDQRDWF